MNPANTYWTKLYNLYSKVDTERARFLEFERWWGGHYLLNKEEMEWIARNLFVGNKLGAGEVESFDGKHRVDLRNIRSPIVVFASWGDDITPPQQALNWIPDLYRNVEEIRLNNQTIVYCLHEKIGHLGIFVSASVAKRETSELSSALELIDTLPPGLYEAIITDTTPGMPGLEHVAGRYLIQFQPRTIDDLLKLDDGRADERAFEVVNRVSQINQGLYETFLSPLVRATSSEVAARLTRDANPARVERWAFSDLNPWMLWVKGMAEMVRANRQPVAPDNPFLKAEQKVSAQIEEALDRYRRPGRAPLQGALRIALARRRGRARAAPRRAARPAGRDLGARGAQAPQARGDRILDRERQRARRLGAAAALRRARGPRGRRAPVQHAAPDDRGNPPGERAFARRAQGGDQAPGVRAGAPRGARGRRAAQARAGDALPAPRLRGGARHRGRARRADAAPGRAPAPRRRHARH
jgi:hypothetical protein